MIDVVYVLGKGSTWNNNEIRYSLRSVEMYLHGFRNVWIVGELPVWLKNVNHIPAKDQFQVPDENIRHKILAACRHPEVSDEFLFINDDHYLLTDFIAAEFPYYYCSTIEQYVKTRGHDGYGNRCLNTKRHLDQLGHESKYYDIHYPIRYNKAKFIEILGELPTKQHGYVLKSLYANAVKVQGIETRDCKFAGTPPPKAVCFSTMPRVNGALYRWFEYKFPEKSNFEV